MELIVVGCSGSVSGRDSPASCYLVQAPHQGRTFSLLLDLGPGAFGALYKYLPPERVDAIALSHLHPDHCLDVCAFYVASRFSKTAPWLKRPLYGPPGTGRRLTLAYDVPRPDNGPTEDAGGIGSSFDYREWQVEQQIGPFRVRTARVDHSVETYALRIEERPAEPAGTPGDPEPTYPSLVFSGDTGPCEALVELATGADLLLVEAAFMDKPDNPRGLHLTGAQAAQAGQRAGVKRVLLTHIPPWHEPADVLAEATAVSDAELTLAVPGQRWPLP